MTVCNEHTALDASAQQGAEYRASTLSLQLQELDPHHEYLSLFLNAEDEKLISGWKRLFELFGSKESFPEVELSEAQAHFVLVNFCIALEKVIAELSVGVVCTSGGNLDAYRV